MFPNVRILIAAVFASVVALSCGFAMFAALRVNHEPLSRLATGAAPLQLAAGNPIPSVAMPAPADSFGNRFPSNQADSAGASPEATPRQPEHDDSVEPPGAVASTTATAPETGAAEPAQPAPVAQAPAAAPDAKPDEVAVAPNEPPPAAPSEPAPAATETAVTEPPAEQAAPAKQRRPRNKPAKNPILTPSRTPRQRAAAEPPPPEAPHKAAHRHRLAAKAQRARQARAIARNRQPADRNRRPVRAATKPPCRQAATRPPSPRDRSTGQPAVSHRRSVRATDEPLSAGRISASD